MYNKYFTMKKSELKEAIKVEITSVLSEAMSDEEREDKLQQAKRGGGKEEPLRKLAAIGKKEDALNEISSTEANAQLMEIVEHQKEILYILKELKKGADLDAAIRIIENEVGKTLTKVKNLKQIKGLQTTFADIREEDEPTASDLKKKDSVATISNKLQKLTAKMKDKAKEFKAAEGEAKEKIKDELKDMTAEKKKLEKSL